MPKRRADPAPGADGGKDRPLLIVGLGNPDREYGGTRHNAGAVAVGKLAEVLGTRLKHKLFRRYFLAEAGSAVLARADTYMNECGPVIAKLAKSRPRAVLLVVSDDLDLPPGRIRFRTGGSAGGHRGIASVIAALGSDSFPRLRIGIGRPGTAGAVVPPSRTPAAQTPAAQTPAAQTPAAQTPAAQTPAAQTPAAQTPTAARGEPVTEARGDVIDWVLSRPAGAEREEFERGIERAAEALRVAVESGLGRAMTEYSE